MEPPPPLHVSVASVIAHQTYSSKSLSSQHVDLDDACAQGAALLTQSLSHPKFQQNVKETCCSHETGLLLGDLSF